MPRKNFNFISDIVARDSYVISSAQTFFWNYLYACKTWKAVGKHFFLQKWKIPRKAICVNNENVQCLS